MDSRLFLNTAMVRKNIIFKFDSGSYKRTQFDQFTKVISKHLSFKKSQIAVLMNELDDFDLKILSKLDYLDKDYDMLGQGVLTFEGNIDFFEQLWILFSQAEPEFIFNFQDSFSELLKNLQDLFKRPFQQHLMESKRRNIFKRIYVSSQKHGYEIISSPFTMYYKPIIHNCIGEIYLYD